MISEVKAMADQRAFELRDLFSVDTYPPRIVQSVAMKNRPLPISQFQGLKFRPKLPLVMFHPFAQQRIVSLVPIGNNPGSAKRGLYGTGNDCGYALPLWLKV